MNYICNYTSKHDTHKISKLSVSVKAVQKDQFTEKTVHIFTDVKIWRQTAQKQQNNWQLSVAAECIGLTKRVNFKVCEVQITIHFVKRCDESQDNSTNRNISYMEVMWKNVYCDELLHCVSKKLGTHIIPHNSSKFGPILIILSL